MCDYPFFIPQVVLFANSSLFWFKVTNEHREFRNYLTLIYSNLPQKFCCNFLQLISDLNVLRTYFFALTTFHTFIGRFPAMFACQPFFLVNCAVASSLVLQLIHAAFFVKRVIYFLHTDNSQNVCNRTQQNNDQTNRCKVFDKYSVQFLSAEWRRLFNFFYHSINTNNTKNQNTGCKCCQRHHY